jgi:hypothetical protein
VVVGAWVVVVSTASGRVVDGVLAPAALHQRKESPPTRTPPTRATRALSLVEDTGPARLKRVRV